jgi:hypothetical protein
LVGAFFCFLAIIVQKTRIPRKKVRTPQEKARTAQEKARTPRKKQEPHLKPPDSQELV